MNSVSLVLFFSEGKLSELFEDFIFFMRMKIAVCSGWFGLMKKFNTRAL